MYEMTKREKRQAETDRLSEVVATLSKGFMTCRSGVGTRPAVVVEFAKLEEAQAFHQALIFAALCRPRPRGGRDA